ncbi:cyclase family protein [Atopobacter sp. AH10]|uniref:cyclase family protein n=1 Tax=Atopobacter sp. AH10 TaxID=2315861 RepID=UPI000EF1D91C|nr:cyclase family protein [Atopobacter sp. AH10]RLK63930.1 cyclase family protein [Atopobacter sp. AH10]
MTQASIDILTAKRIDLTHAIHSEIPHFHAFDPLKEKTLYTIEKDGFLAKEYTLPTAYSTHIDTPGHFSKGKRLLEKISLEELILPLYVLHLEEEVAKNPDFGVDKATILAYEKEHGEIPSGSFVAFSSGWSEKFSDPKAYYNIDEKGIAHTPGWTVEALEFLAHERQVKAIGHETLDTDPGIIYHKTQALDGEFYWLDQDRYQVEVLNNLRAVPTKGAVIVVAPAKVVQAPSFPARVFALVPETVQ